MGGRGNPRMHSVGPPRVICHQLVCYSSLRRDRAHPSTANRATRAPDRALQKRSSLALVLTAMAAPTTTVAAARLADEEEARAAYQKRRLGRARKAAAEKVVLPPEREAEAILRTFLEERRQREDATEGVK
mmetsp:Transcript_17012/g.49153  ORF Transcript_17012/g.49153 Transcript_17012/m.49153 type:complete len:131 (+) Transcript_17012:103-495(+)